MSLWLMSKTLPHTYTTFSLHNVMFWPHGWALCLDDITFHLHYRTFRLQSRIKPYSNEGTLFASYTICRAARKHSIPMCLVRKVERCVDSWLCLYMCTAFSVSGLSECGIQILIVLLWVAKFARLVSWSSGDSVILQESPSLTWRDFSYA
jgi:hypothetical protein